MRINREENYKIPNRNSYQITLITIIYFSIKSIVNISDYKLIWKDNYIEAKTVPLLLISKHRKISDFS